MKHIFEPTQNCFFEAKLISSIKNQHVANNEFLHIEASTVKYENGHESIAKTRNG
jgi:hypothetical protein